MNIKKQILRVPIVRHLFQTFEKPNPATKHLTTRVSKPRINYTNFGHE